MRQTCFRPAVNSLGTAATLLGFAFMLLCVAVTGAQGQGGGARAGTTPAPYKGLLEPVSYSESITLRDVFFVNVNVGWASGDHGTIIHTKDGGATWEAQLGGDPQDHGEIVSKLHFVDERHGWALWHAKLLRTTDGESWEEVSKIPLSAVDIAFVDARHGFLVAGDNSSVGSIASAISRTDDGGKTWKQMWICEARVPVGPVTRTVGCRIKNLQFVTPTFAVAAAENLCQGSMSCSGPPLIIKTEDGGETWTGMLGPGDPDEGRVVNVFFADEQRGYAWGFGGRLSMTTDGGATWKGVAATGGREIRFADPEVGWSLEPGFQPKVAFTTDGGVKWTSRRLGMPGNVRAFSLPRRDRAYLVGDDGLVYRYSVVPASKPVGKYDAIAPAMPLFETAADEQVAELGAVVQEMSGSLGNGGGSPVASDAGSAEKPVTAGEGDASAEPLDAPLPAAAAVAAACCKKSFSRLEVVLAALGQSLPQFVGKYRNLNLLLAGVRMGSEMPSQLREVRRGLKAFRQAPDKQSASAALASVTTALAALRESTAISTQSQLPPAMQ